jgi:hypothetical protein
MVNPTMHSSLYSVFNMFIKILTSAFLIFSFNLGLIDVMNMHQKYRFKHLIYRFQRPPSRHTNKSVQNGAAKVSLCV